MSPAPSREESAHAVQFYDRDEVLSASVGGHLAEGLAAGGSAVVVATPAHRMAFAAELAGRGIDVNAARAAGRLRMVDAAELLSGFMIDQRLDPERFHALAGGLVGQAARAGRPVRVYGEMVVLLWEAGHVSLALELEALWNEQASRSPFSLLCAYPGNLVAGEENGGALEEVCQLHTNVIGDDASSHRGPAGPAGGLNAEREFPEVRDSVRKARHFVLGLLESRYDQETADDAAMVTTELAANAVLHAGSGFTVAVSGSAEVIRISVRDRALPNGGRSLPVQQGHGLDVVGKLARRWSVELRPDGKVVWAELPAVTRARAR